MSSRASILHSRSARPLVKVCCISSVDEARIALDAGVDLLGLVSHMPSGPGVIPDDLICAISEWVGQRAPTVLLTSRQDAAAISQQIAAFRPGVLQLVDDVSEDEVTLLRHAAALVSIMQVIHVRDTGSFQQAERAAAFADAILLDSGNPSAAIKELGGTGRVHDWSISRSIRDAVDVPVFLAGGLNSRNVAEAIAAVRPYGVDVCSGVRREGRLDPAMLGAFMTAARAVA